MSLLNLPDVVLEHIFSFLSYDNVAQNRVVCKCFNVIGGRVLNKGFYAVERYNSKVLRELKTKLPRRESERRNHPLARQCDVLISIETRINMLTMTFSKWININTCCFIPGKVIDEIYRVLKCVLHDPNPPRGHEILQELRDISSMAMEHFEEKILPQIKRKYLTSRDMLLPFSIREELKELKSIMKRGRRLGHVEPVLLNKLSKVNSIQSSQSVEDISLLPGPSLPISSSPSSSSTNGDLSSQDCSTLSSVSPNNQRFEFLSIMHQTNVNTLLINHEKEISGLKKQVKAWEAKFRDLSASVTKLQNQSSSPTLHIDSTPNLKRGLEEDESTTSNKMRRRIFIIE